MAATANRNTPETVARGYLSAFTVKDEAHIYAGTMVALKTGTLKAEPAADAAGLVVLGRAACEVDNRDDGLSVRVEQGVFRYANSGSHALTRAHIGAICYVEDDQTVSSDAGTNAVRAGVVHDVDTRGVWVIQTALTVVGEPVAPEE